MSIEKILSEDLLNILNTEGSFDSIAKEIFEKADLNKNGLIEKSELKNCLEQVAKALKFPQPTLEKVDATFSRLDIDNSGTIEYKEFTEYVKNILIEAITDSGSL